MITEIKLPIEPSRTRKGNAGIPETGKRVAMGFAADADRF
jgi:hypothetical protein